MSLILRKNCQTVLDEFRLQEFHVAISEHSHLSIVSECGKPLINIIGIVFAKKQPTLAEIDYAMELLEAFLATHIAVITDYVKKLAAFNKKPVLHRDVDLFSVTNKYNGELECSYNDGQFEVKISNKSQEVDVKSLDNCNVSDLLLTKFSKKLEKAARAHMTAVIKYEAEQNKLSSIKSSLSKCDI